MSERTSQRLVALDGIRGVAALVVLLFHLHLPISDQFDRGYLMVDLFFMLSGFVLTLSVEPRLQGGWPWWRFMLARYRRLLPVVLVGVAIGALGYWTVIEPEWAVRTWIARLAMASLLLPVVWITKDPALFPLNRLHWSLLFELLANLLHALVLWRLNIRGLAICVAFLGVLYALSVFHMGGSTAGAFQDAWLLGIPRVLFSYGAGMLLARLWQIRPPKLPIPALAGPILAPMAILLAAPLPIWLGDALVVTLLFPLILWAGAATRPQGAVSLTMTWLGAISYPLYAVHGPVLQLAREYGSGVIAESVGALVSLAIAMLLAVTLERARTHRRVGTRQPASPLASNL